MYSVMHRVCNPNQPVVHSIDLQSKSRTLTGQIGEKPAVNSIDQNAVRSNKNENLVNKWQS